MTSPKYRFNVTGGSGSAARVDMLDNERSVFTQGTYTACQCESNPAWYIRGSEFDFDTGADEGVAHNGVLFFQGVPIFGSPWLSFPLSGDRRSGFLPPTFSLGSTNGFELDLPYYFNIAPNRDLLLTPKYHLAAGSRDGCDVPLPVADLFRLDHRHLPAGRRDHEDQPLRAVHPAQPELRQRVRRLHLLQQGFGQYLSGRPWLGLQPDSQRYAVAVPAGSRADVQQRPVVGACARAELADAGAVGGAVRA